MLMVACAAPAELEVDAGDEMALAGEWFQHRNLPKGAYVVYSQDYGFATTSDVRVVVPSAAVSWEPWAACYPRLGAAGYWAPVQVSWNEKRGAASLHTLTLNETGVQQCLINIAVTATRGSVSVYSGDLYQR